MDELSNVVIAGDFNEFVRPRSVFAPFDDILTEIDANPGLDPVERYTCQSGSHTVSSSYGCRSERLREICDLNQSKDHTFISKENGKHGPKSSDLPLTVVAQYVGHSSEQLQIILRNPSTYVNVLLKSL